MTFSSIIIKNIKFNFKKYIAYFIANSFIIAVLLMYGSLMFSKEFIEISKANDLTEGVNAMLMLMIAFSIVFIAYTTISFIRYRGKEFGVYLTLGVTTKDLRKMLFIENILILFASMLTGMIVGTLFSRLFYMIIGKILWIDNFRTSLNIKTYFMCLVIAIIIFLINSIFQMIFVGRLSIMELIKSSSRAEVGKTNFIIGTIALIALITALYLFPKIVNKEIFKESENAMLIIIITTIIAPYFIIGSLISMINRVLVNFKKTYNNNLLVLSSMQHKFTSYKSVIYLVLILASAAITLISMTYSIYATIEEKTNYGYPYDIRFIENTKLNKISDQELKNIVKASGGEIKQHKLLESINLMDYRAYEGIVTESGNIAVISERNYNNHMGTNLVVNKGELVQVSNSPIDSKYKDDEESDEIINFNDLSKQKKQIAKFEKDKNISVEVLLANMDKDSYIYVEKNKKKYTKGKFTNDSYSLAYSMGTALIINDEDYKRIKEKLGAKVVSYDHLINLKDPKDYKSFNSISSELKKLNHGDESLKPEFKQQMLEERIRENGFILFSSLFLGMMLLISSGVVLYFKVLTGVAEEKERVKKLVQLGMTDSEISKILTKKLAIIFFTPVVLAVSLITYFLSTLFGVVPNGDYMFNKSLCVVVAYIVLQIVAFFITRGRYIREVVG
ncbi:FtsX-like permease family protein [Clostridium estertheticum]|uniref:FtsX-like permease family protein n=1 Tax=Clostridium estertheticum TaxID=238834 RepID=UPI001C6E6E98|nr:ABC transporter permease [Clostridium estertheticum]MBW9151164.1 ABC transporter permease [Clostridium estertheticum]WLC84845.1 ABC transporter permease [Clostridium estertheticum]